MEDFKPTKPKRAPRATPRKAKVEKPKPEEENAYAIRTKIGEPTIGRSSGYVTKVGLGNLKVQTH